MHTCTITNELDKCCRYVLLFTQPNAFQLVSAKIQKDTFVNTNVLFCISAS